jgi:hypothetical protein
LTRRSFALLLAALALAPGAAAAPVDGWERRERAAQEALARSVAAKYVDAVEAERYLAILGRARAVWETAPPLRSRLLESVLGQIARYRSPTAQRALELYSTLEVNADYLESHRIPDGSLDVVGTDGAVYRFFPGRGLQFHPLANAAKLNALARSRDPEETRRLADALAARALPQPGRAAVWEYLFDFDVVPAPWTSGMAQAVLAQALARAGGLLEDPSVLGLAGAAYRAVPGELDRDLGAGPWVRLYSSSPLVVLNAQLQSAVSLADYAELAADADASRYATRLLDAARALLPRFDTGPWSRYALGQESALSYHDYVVDLLKRLGTTTGDPFWADAAARFERYETEPPALTGVRAAALVYPKPRDGIRDDAGVRFWLSKISRVTLVVGGRAVDSKVVGRGWGSIDWRPSPAVAAGSYPARLVARDLAGNHGTRELPAIEVARDLEAPTLAAAKARGKVYWRTKDRESACCQMRLELRRKGMRTVVPLPDRKRASVTLARAAPSGYWAGTLVAVDAAGNRAERELGLVVGG